MTTYSNLALRTILCAAALGASGCGSLVPSPHGAQSLRMHDLAPPPVFNQGYDECVKAGGDPQFESLMGKHSPVGCSHVNNLHAMVLDPEDLKRAKPSSPIDLARRGVILGKYRAGEDTASTATTKGSDALVSSGE